MTENLGDYISVTARMTYAEHDKVLSLMNQLNQSKSAVIRMAVNKLYETESKNGNV